ncbi:glycoside hydrolase family 127 protein [Prevotella sp. E2-28]|uniref:glycoside hydrolase family 127 protein n=1 Tax=Prevotella sp. E2-28 TaxID=2913620 RepID=UPI001EDA4D4A|nr:glycoside hydrolase family 127 protein [Prevotella sp. E2-28]UKK53576.1 glycoside hydrolase family 127 protein [Prevotella sp. E2-28]
MKKILLSLIICHLSFSHAVAQTGYPITPVPFTAVKVTSGTFWGQRLEASRNVTIPLAFSKCESEGRYKNFENAAAHLKDPSKVFKVNGVGYSFDDTDPYKTLEGAAYILQTYPDKKLEAYCDSVIDIIASAQEPDGYLYTARTQNPADPHHWAGDRRWVKEEDLSHELYNLGHMIEGAVAYWQATGKRKFLDIACRYADVACKEVGPNPGQMCVVPGHQIAEMAMARLYLATGQQRYLDFAKFLLDYRGKTTIKTEYSQSHKPVVKQDEAVGHAVRAAYMYAGMADVAALTGDKSYINAIDDIWWNIVEKKLYITGGIGATNNGEAFGKNYELPNMSAYCETCAAIGNVYVNYRLFLLHGNSKYYDVLERTLYNGLISGVSLQGNGFFYPNPLESMGQHQRQAWFGCACCPSNICRFIPSLPGYVYAVKDNNVYVNLFLSNKSTLNVGKKKVELSQQTNYPWEGDITINIDKTNAGIFTMKIRIPGWLKGSVVPAPSQLYEYTDGKRLNYTVTVNGKAVESMAPANAEQFPDGYLNITRKWKKGDKIQLHFDMEPRIVRANNKVEADRGMVAIERGPLVYCAEHPDNNFDIFSTLINQEPKFTLGKGEIAGTSVVTIKTDVQTLDFNKQGKLTTKDETLTLIPYYAWCHRGSGKMRVWLPQDLKATTPAQPATLASESKVTSGSRVPALSSINDRLVPRDENDRSVPYTHWWPKKASTEWLAYEFPQPATVQTCTVYWFDDAPWGGCRVPKSWRILYQDEKGEWQPVEGADRYPTVRGAACTVNFNPVKAKSLRLEVTQPDEFSSGLFEWIVK